jgi:hypothetical protein
MKQQVIQRNMPPWYFDKTVGMHEFKDVEPIVPAGTALRQISFHDNTAVNPSNPDPSNWIPWGERTADEGYDTRINYYFITEEECKERLAAWAAGKAKRKAPVSEETASSARLTGSGSDVK